MGQVVDGIELVLLPAADAGLLYGVTDPDDLAWMAERLTGHPWKCFEQPLALQNEDALWAIPQYHIICSSTLATREKTLMERARAEGRLWEIDTGHDLMITEPARTADALAAGRSGLTRIRRRLTCIARPGRVFTCLHTGKTSGASRGGTTPCRNARAGFWAAWAW